MRLAAGLAEQRQKKRTRPISSSRSPSFDHLLQQFFDVSPHLRLPGLGGPRLEVARIGVREECDDGIPWHLLDLSKQAKNPGVEPLGIKGRTNGFWLPASSNEALFGLVRSVCCLGAKFPLTFVVWPELYLLMDADSSSLPTNDLLSDLEWLGQLARRLVSDPDLADDACQEAWLAASRKGHGARIDRQSLTQFVRSYIWRARRSNQRRRAHEFRAARPDQLPSTEELLLIGERQQELWRHLSELPEPYRSTLLLHFQQGIAPGEIASRSGLAVATVRWRLRRGLEVLKESLERDEDGPRLMGMVPLAVASTHPWKTTVVTTVVGGSKAAGVGAFLMTKNLAIAVGAAILLVLGWTLFSEPTLEPSGASSPKSSVRTNAIEA